MSKDPKTIENIKVDITGDLAVMEPPKGLGNEGKQVTKVVLADI